MSRVLEKRLKKVPQYTRLMRHLKSFKAHSTIKKIFNLILAEREWFLRRETVRSHPYILIIDPTSACNLRCPLCPTGMGIIGRRSSSLSYEGFRQIIDQVGQYAYEIFLHNWGEPLLNREIFEMIEYAQSKNIGANLSTNFNLINNADVERLARSSLEYLIVSIDGTTDEVYSYYRKGGNFQRVMKNLKDLLSIRQRLKRKTPIVEWQFIVMKHNVHQVEDARRLAGEIGVDLFRVVPVGLPFDAQDREILREQWFPKLGNLSSEAEVSEYQFLQKRRKVGCYYLYRSLIVNSDGRVAPCCIVYGDKNDFGEILTQDFAQLWNNEYYRSARSLFSKEGNPTVPTACERCNIFERRKENLLASEKGRRKR
jgi:radical SAM protein with 4Fe4S-binding SPASM domain